MKKHNPSNGQNDKLVHWWLLVHFSHFGGLQNKRLINYYFTFFKKKNLTSFSFPFPLVFSHFLSFHYFFFFFLPCFFSFCWFFLSYNNKLLEQLIIIIDVVVILWWYSLVCFFVFGGVKEPSSSFFCHHHPFSELQWSSM